MVSFLLHLLGRACMASFARLDTWLANRHIKRQREQYMERTGGDQRCPHCDKWASEMGGWASAQPDPEDQLLDEYTCKNCGGKSSWLFGPGVMLLMKPRQEKNQ